MYDVLNHCIIKPTFILKSPFRSVEIILNFVTLSRLSNLKLKTQVYFSKYSIRHFYRKAEGQGTVSYSLAWLASKL